MDAAQEEYESIGLFYPNHRNREAHSLSEKELDDVLTPHGIIYGLDGSRSYRIIVPKARAREARQLLAEARFRLGEVELSQ
jgi:hypothetical protein